MPRGLTIAAAALAVIALCTACPAVDTWEQLMPGVQHLHRIDPGVPWDIHVLIIDVTNPRVQLRAAIRYDNDKPGVGRETVRSMCRRYDAVAGVNTDFWGGFDTPDCPQGHTMTDGLIMLPTGRTSPPVPDRTTMMIPPGNTYVNINKVVSMSPWFNVTAGGPRMIRNGVVGWESETDIPDMTTRQPRTAAAITSDWRTLILATCDGRQPDSAGMTANEMGYLLTQFGGYQGMMFDGGGSTTMVINGETVNDPSDAGGDRAVAACLMVLDRHRQPANPAVHYETGFEDPPFAQGDLSGIDQWFGSGSVAAVGHGGDQSARFSAQSAYRNVSPVSLTGVQWVECWAKASSTGSGGYVYAGTANATDVAAAVRFGAGGQIEAADGAAWVNAGAYAANTWYRIHFRIDYNISTYQVFVNGALKASGLSFLHAGASAGLRGIKAGAAGGDFFIDDIYVGNVDPAFLRVSPDSCLVVQGGRRQFSAASGAAPVVWSVTEERDSQGQAVPAGTIAQISSTGVLTALAPGFCVVRAQDGTGRTDTSSQITVVAAQPIHAARTLTDGSNVALSGLKVTGRFDGFLYAQSPDRRSGIRIMTTKAVAEGSEIYVTGYIGTVNGERVINQAAVQVCP